MLAAVSALAAYTTTQLLKTLQILHLPKKKRKSCLSNVLRDHPYIASAKSLGRWVQRMAVFVEVHYCIYVDIVGGWASGCWVGRLEQAQKSADVIYGFRNANIQPALLSSQLQLKWRARAEHTSLTL